MRKNIEIFAKICVYASFFVPLIVLPSSFIFPFIVPKIVVLRSLITLTFAAYALLLISNWEKYRPRGTWLNIALGGFLASFFLSTIFGVDAYHSFWDNHERMLGLFTIFHYVAYYFVCSALFTNWTEWKWALRIFLIAGSMVMLIGLLQVVKPDFLLNQGSARVVSTLGNSIYVGGYGLFLIFVSYLLFIKEKEIVWKWVQGILGFLAFLGLFFSGTRGTILGLLVGIAVTLISYAVMLKQYPATRKILAAIAAISFVMLVGLYLNRETSFVKRIPAVGRTLNTSWTDVASSPRLIAWNIAVESWKEKPVFGWGPNNFFYAFNKHYNPRSLQYGYGETWFDNAHNIILNTLAVQGAVGLLTYLAIFFIGIATLISAYRRNRIDPHLAIAGTAFLAAHLVQNVTVFENPTSYLYFMFWLALINRLAGYKEAEIESVAPPAERKVPGALVGAVALVALFFIYILNVQPAKANQMSLEALRALGRDPVEGITAMKKAFAFSSPHIDDIRNDIGRTAVGTLMAAYQQLGKERGNEIVTIVNKELEKNAMLHPMDIRVYIALAQLKQIEAQLNNNGLPMLDAEKYLTTALEHSPRRQQIMYSLAGIKLQVHKNQEAVQLLEQAITDNPRIGESYWRLAYTYKFLGKDAEARATLDRAIENGVKFNEDEESIVREIMATSTPASK